MKRLTKLACVLAAMAVVLPVYSSAPILLKSGTINPETGATVATVQTKTTVNAQVAVTIPDRGLYLVQCPETVSAEWYKALESTGAKIRSYIPENAYIVDATADAYRKIAANVPHSYLGEFKPEYRVDESVLQDSAEVSTTATGTRLRTVGDSTNTVETKTYDILLFEASDLAAVSERISKLGGCEVLPSVGAVIRAKLTSDAVLEIASWVEVHWIEPYVEPTINNNVAVQEPRMNVQTVWPDGASNLGLTGAGQVVAVADTGLDTGNLSTVHEDVRGRILKAYSLAPSGHSRFGDWSDPAGHGTHVAGSVLGNGAKSDGSIKGTAYEAKLIFQSAYSSTNSAVGCLPTDKTELFWQTYTNQNGNVGARIHSNSWGSSQAGKYNSNSVNVDSFMFSHPDFLAVFSAGNDGADANKDGIVDSTSIGAPGTAKNCLTVGASENYRTSGGLSTRKWGQAWPTDFPSSPIFEDYISRPGEGNNQGIAAFSSRGPCKDNRVKPDIVAPGTDVLSVRSSKANSGFWGNYNSYYAYMGGTSMSTPLVAGSAALIRQWLQEYKNISNPDGATIKAVLLAGAKSLTPGQYGTGQYREIPASYPNNVEGWGQANVGNAVANANGVVVHDAQIIANGETQTFTFTAQAGSALSIVMAYTDAPGSTSSSKALVNNLDLLVTTPSGTAIYPNSQNSPDNVNNVEGVRIASAEAGVYTATVTATSITTGMASGLVGGRSLATRYSLVANGANGTETSTTTLPTALDNTTLSFTTDGSSSWFGQTTITHDGVDAARSGALGNSQTNWLQTTVSGPGTVSFWWYVSSEANFDYLEFLVDGSVIWSISGTNNVWDCKSHTISTSGSHTLQWRYRKDGSVYKGEDAGFVDQVTWTPQQSYSVTYALNSGTHGTTHPTNATYGTAFKVSAPSRTGYTFAGWTVTSGLDASTAKYGTSSSSQTTSITSTTQKCLNGATGDVWFLNLTSTANGSVTLTANWTAKTYSVTLNSQGGSGGTSSVTATYGSSMPSMTKPTRDGYMFGGYYSGTNGSGTQYYNAAGVSSRSWNIANATTLYAYWIATVPLSTALDNSTLSFTTGGAANWVGITNQSYYGGSSAMSGAITHSQTTWMQTEVSGEGILSFWYKVSSESEDWDYLTFSLDGTSKMKAGGLGSTWQQFTCVVSNNTQHVFKWTYSKDAIISAGSDCCWIDKVEWTPSGSWQQSCYDLRTLGRVTSVKAVGGYGTSWAFDALGSLESTLLGETGRTYDFSENNMVNLAGFDWGFNDGGNSSVAQAYLLRWDGPVLETQDQYPSIGTSVRLPPVVHVQNVLYISSKTSALDNARIKRAIVEDGGVYASFKWSTATACYNSSTHAYYNGSSSVLSGLTGLIVGWDDNYSKTNFSTQPSGDGAYIVRLSWGASFGESGYVYVSYYDTTMAYSTMYVFKGEPTSNYTRNYQYDPLGMVSSRGYGSSVAHGANIFTAVGAEKIAAVGVYVLGTNATYTIKVYADCTADNPVSGILKSEKTVSFVDAGFYTVPLDEEFSVSAGQRFSVVVGMSVPGYNNPIAVEYAMNGYSSAATAESGQSFISANGTAWTDLTTIDSTANFCCKAYAKALPIDVTFEANGGSVSPSNAVLNAGVPYGTLPTPTRTGYTFAGWWTTASGGTQVTTTSIVPASATTLFAHWTANTYTVTYTLNGGTHGTTHPSFATYDTAFYVSAPSQTGYTFAGWTVTSGLNTSTAKWGTTSSTSTSLANSATRCLNGATGNVYFKNLRATSGSVTLTANWEATGPIWTIDANGNLTAVDLNGYTDIVIPDTVRNIGTNVFRSTAITSVMIPNSVTNIGSYAFYGCSSLTSVTIPNSVTSIGASAFYSCSGLTGVYITDIATWCRISFGNSSANPLYYARNLYLDDSLLTNLVIPNSVTSIGSYAFYNGRGLTSVTIPNSVTNIGSYAFYYCSGLTSVHITDIVAWCRISFGNSSANPLYYARNLYLDDSLLTNLVIPNSVTSIGSYAFYNGRGLTSVTIPNSVTNIGSYAFYYCSGLTSVTIPNSVTGIGSYAFGYCSGLTSVTIPNSVTSIGSYAFCYCRGLTSVTIPDSVTGIIGSGVFSNCSGLTSVTIPNSITGIGSSVFSGCSGLTSVTIPNSVTGIGSGAFSGCSSLASVTIPDSVTGIWSGAFSSCGALTNVTILGRLNNYSVASLYSNTPTDLTTYVTANWTGPTDTWLDRPVAFLKHSVAFNANGGTGTMPNQDVVWYATSNLTANAFSKTGYFFAGWATNATGAVVYANGTSITPSADMTLYAKWTANTYSISYSLNSGTHGATHPSSVTYDAAFYVSAPSRTGYTFAGWTVTSGLNTSTAKWGTTSSPSTSLTSSATTCVNGATGNVYFKNLRPTSGSVTLTANWTANTYTVYYTLNSGTHGTTHPSSATYDTAFYVSAPSRTGYTFAGWTVTSGLNTSTAKWGTTSSPSTSLTSSATTCLNGVTGNVYFKNLRATSGSVTLTANWTCNHSSTSLLNARAATCTEAGHTGNRVCDTCGAIIETGTTIPALGHQEGAGVVTQEPTTTAEGVMTYSCTRCGITMRTEAIPKLVTTPTWTIDANGNLTAVDLNGCTDIVIPDTVRNIGTNVFRSTAITSVTIPNSVTNIGAYAFYGCSGLTSVTIPNSVTSIGSSAFYNCSGLTSVHITDIAAWCRVTFGNGSANPLYHAHNLYLAGSLLKNLVIPNNVTSIGPYAFYYCSGLMSVTIPNSVTSIGSSAFYNCLGLVSVTIPNSVTSIGSYAFYNCRWLASVTIPNSVTNIWPSAFYSCSGLKSVHITDIAAWCRISFGNGSANPLYYARNLYLDGSLLKNLVIPNGVTSIGSSAFEGCSGLTSVTIPNSVTSIGTYAFYGCSGVTSVTIPNSVTSIESYAFYGCSGLTGVTIPNSVTSIGSYAFRGCSGLTSVTIPNSVTNIGSSAFYGCRGLTSVTMLGDVPTAGSIYSGCPDNLITYVTPAWTGPADRWQDRAVIVVVGANTLQGEAVNVSTNWICERLDVPLDWFSKHPTFVTSLLESPAANGRRSVAECYVLGVDPEDPDDDFRITSFEMVNGNPVFTFNHTEDGSGVSLQPRIRKMGAAALDGEWHEVDKASEADKAKYRFFKVVVELP